MGELAVTAFITLLVIVDPVGVAAVFAGLTPGHDPAQRRDMAIRGSVIAAAVLFFFALAGELLLRYLGVSFAALRIAGGILLFLLAVDMVLARPSGLRTLTPGEGEEAWRREDLSVFPLAIPLIAGPGAMTSVLLLMSDAGTTVEQGLVLAILLGVLVLTLLALLAATAITRVLGLTGTNVVSRVLGVVLAALATQFVIDGIEQSF